MKLNLFQSPYNTSPSSCSSALRRLKTDIPFESGNFLEDFLDSFPSPFISSRSGFSPNLDVKEDEDSYFLELELPGINKEDVNISLQENTLTIKGEKSTKTEKEETKEHFHIRERSHGSFTRNLRFPVAVEGSKIDARFKDGLLKISIPKREEVKPKSINIQTSDAS